MGGRDRAKDDPCPIRNPGTHFWKRSLAWEDSVHSAREWISSQAGEELAASSGDRLSFEWLIGPIGREVFFEQYWEKQPLVVKRNQPDYFRSLLTLDEVDRALTTLDLRYPNVTLKNADRTITADDYTVRGESLDVAKVYQLFEEGSTITLAFLDNVIPLLASFCRGLEKEFSCPLQTTDLERICLGRSPKTVDVVE